MGMDMFDQPEYAKTNQEEQKKTEIVRRKSESPEPMQVDSKEQNDHKGKVEADEPKIDEENQPKENGVEEKPTV